MPTSTIATITAKPCRYWFSCECKACKGDWPLLKANTTVKWKTGEQVGRRPGTKMLGLSQT